MAQDGRDRTSRKSEGVQLPMELSFISVDKPGRRVPYWQLSQITAHAMRKNHERRRGLESNTPQGQQPQKIKWTRGYKDHLRKSGPGKSSHSNYKDHRSPKEASPDQQDAPHTMSMRTSTVSIAETHLTLRPKTPSLHEHTASEEIVSPTPPAASASAFADMIFGGLRTDPFLRYPIKFEDYFPAAVDHCREVIVPDLAFFELIMTHDVLFEAILTFVLCTHLAQTPDLQKAMLSHYGGTLSKVRERLLWPGPTRRAVMAAISNLAGICAYLGDDTSFTMHRNALRYLGGFNDDQDLRKHDVAPKRPPKFHDALSFAQPRPKGEANLFDKHSTILQPSRQNATEPVYPTLPFSPELSSRLSRVPEGFRELVLKRSISIQVIERLAMYRCQIVRLASRATMDREHSKVLRESFTPLERLIWLAFSVFHLCTATYRVDREELAETFIECSRKMIRRSKAENECLLWAGCIVATTQAVDDWELPQRTPVMEIVLSRFNMSIEQMNAVARKFLWNETMGAGLTAIMRHRFIAVPMIEEGEEWRTWL